MKTSGLRWLARFLTAFACGLLLSMVYLTLAYPVIPFHGLLQFKLASWLDSIVKSALLFLPVCLVGQAGLPQLVVYVTPITFFTLAIASAGGSWGFPSISTVLKIAALPVASACIGAVLMLVAHALVIRRTQSGDT
ncbi:hypothetical protein [Massilia sp. ST3]|uniref:hypothetical protein n=1 Tax=Massilia sp. ST3 TaxID=2824903 RepID=UPI001B8244FB|nr:hypothetical protein [Massilia sp. ST3]MBQ5949899.1 hypothetical protein [Massilia sp. ST3]